MNLLSPKQNGIPSQGMSTHESVAVGKLIGHSNLKHVGGKIIHIIQLAFATVFMAVIALVDINLLAGTMGTAIWDEFGEENSAVYIPLAIVMIAAFAHRLVSKQTNDQLKKSWVGRLVRRLSLVLMLSSAILFSATMLENLYPLASMPAPVDGNTANTWGQPSAAAIGYADTLMTNLAAVVSPLAEGTFALFSGGILILTAFLLAILMDWWYSAFKALTIGQAQHKDTVATHEEIKRLRKDYVPIAAAANSEAAKTPEDHEMEFAVFFVNDGFSALVKQRAELSDRKLKERINNPAWPEIGENSFAGDPTDLLQQRKEFEASLNIDNILATIRRDY